MRTNLGNLQRRGPHWWLGACLALAAALWLGGCEEDGAKKQSASASSYVAAGLPDITFGVNGYVHFDIPGILSQDHAEAMAIQPDGKIVLAGWVTNSSPFLNDIAVARVHPDGTVDGTFGNHSGAFVFDFDNGNDRAHAVAIQADGKIVVAGEVANSVSGNQDLIVMRLDTNGSIDTSFATGGLYVSDGDAGYSSDDAGKGIAVDSQQRIVVVGQSYSAPSDVDAMVWRFDSTGTLDGNFNGSGMQQSGLVGAEAGNAVAIEPITDNVVMAGSSFGGTIVPTIWRFLGIDGQPDTNFDSDGWQDLFNATGGATDTFNAVLIEPNGNIVAAGASLQGSTTDAGVVWRVLPNGQPDTSFGAGSSRTVLGGSGVRRVWGVARDGSGNYYLCGEGPGGSSDMYLWRITPAGTLDPAFVAGVGYFFDGGSGADLGSACKVDGTGNIVVAGSRVHATSDLALWRFF
ncbi:MAG TPA: delta-60 repeat domain-containing protein [bacterium]